MLTLAELTRDERWRPRRKLRPHTIAELARLYRDGGPAALPPILAGRLPGTPGLLLVDGWHRVAAAERAGLTALPGLVEEYAHGWEAYEEAVRRANLAPQSLTLGEKGRNIDAFLVQFPQIGPCELAQRLGVTREYVWRRKKRLTAEAVLPDPMARHAQRLLKELAALWEAEQPEPPLSPEERLDAVMQALVAAARRCEGETGALWLERLDAAARGASQLLAGQPPNAAAAGRVPLRAAA